MGIDIKIESTIDNEWNKSLGINSNCKLAWDELGINWQIVFELIRFEPTRLYDHSPGFWSCDQLEYVLNEIIKLKNNPDEFNKEYILEQSDSINKLIWLFGEYVNKKCRMIIY